jgi:PAS domain S-box-containing protein
MLHSIKMIKHYYPKYKDYKVAVVSPCIAKKREFEETGIGDYNIAIKSIDNYFQEHNINLNDFPLIDFDNPKAERAVLFSSPGGLLKTAERSINGISDLSRKIEGQESVYEYLDKLPDIINKKIAPVIVDCLNCKNGCNGGPVALAKDKSIDEIEFFVNQRSNEYKEYYAKNKDSVENIDELLNRYWQEDLYKREYKNLWENVELKYPNKDELNNIFVDMHKYSEEDIFNCVSCGYSSCKKMATAIFNRLNKPENCHHYLQTEKDISQVKTRKSEQRVNKILETAHDGFVQINNDSIIQQANLTFKSMVKRNDVVGRSFYEFLNDENKKILSEHVILRDQNKKSSYEITLQQTDGNEIICLSSGAPMLDENGEKIGSFGMLSDITELKAAEFELRRTNDNLENKVLERTEKLNEMLEELKVSNEMVQSYNQELEKLSIVASEIDNATIIMNSKGDFEWINEGYTKMFGLTNSQAIGTNIISKTTSKKVSKQITTAIKNASSTNFELELKDNKKSRWVHFTITPILNKDESVNKLIAIGTDITTIKEKEIEIENQRDEIEAQRDLVMDQKGEIERANVEMTDSINYAKHIQKAIFPQEEFRSKLLPEHFVYLNPKNIVSGDFYWLTQVEEKVIVTAADCTGHGVPGAFMSILGLSFLNDIVNKEYITHPGVILRRLRKEVIHALQQKGELGEISEGMDIALSSIDFKNLELQFSGANNPLYIIRNKEFEPIPNSVIHENSENILYEIKGDHMPISIHVKMDRFKMHEIKLMKGDCIYMFSDGFADQFGGDNGKKFKYKPFKELLLSNVHKSMQEQKHILNESFIQWKGNYEQVDDVVVIGFKI